ncbi:MAG: GGDEF domain-containing protein [Candidatus Pacebacteria bacterium]|nr:GGDEF domain-containing protein [Candidatus Paceibacterota bacterium]
MKQKVFQLKPRVPAEMTDLRQLCIRQRCKIRTLNHEISQMKDAHKAEQDAWAEERRRHHIEIREAVRNALVDRLCSVTGLYTRDKYVNELPHQIDMVQRYSTSFALVSVDLTDFKQVNDTYGHAVGDAVLAAFGPILQAAFRKTDFVIRWGGDEFCVIMLHADTSAAQEGCERLRTLIATHFHIHLDDGTKVDGAAKIAFGVCTPDLASHDAFSQQAFERAIDQALYRAGETGQIEVAMFDAQAAA